MAGLVPLLTACDGVPRATHQTLHVVLVPTGRVEWLQQDFRDQLAWQPLLDNFRQIYPNVHVQLSVHQEAQLNDFLTKAKSRGLGPDLLLVRSPTAVSLLERGLVLPIPETGAVRNTLALLTPTELSRVRTAKGIAGLPVFNEVTLACYNRTHLAQPPTTIASLLAVATSGRTIGLSVEPIGIWWTAGAYGAQQAMGPIIVGNDGGRTPDLRRDRQALRHWLQSLRGIALENRVDVGTGPEELTRGLESGRLSWIPCYSITLQRLDRTMGKRLGVAVLPSGPSGLPSPYSSLRVWALGADSSPSQQRLALALMQLSLDPLVQRDITLTTRMVLPANRNVQVPVASSGRLAVLAGAQGQFEQGTALMSLPFSADRVQRVLPIVQNVISQVMVGVLSAEQGADRLLELRPRAGAGR